MRCNKNKNKRTLVWVAAEICNVIYIHSCIGFVVKKSRKMNTSTSHINTKKHIYKDTLLETQTQMYFQRHTHIQTHMLTHTQTTHINTQSHTYVYMLIHTHRHTYMHQTTYNHTKSYIYMLIHTQTHIRTHVPWSKVITFQPPCPLRTHHLPPVTGRHLAWGDIPVMSVTLSHHQECHRVS